MLRSIDVVLRVRAVVPLVLVAVELVLDVFVQRPRRRGEVARRGGRYRFCKTGYDLPDVRR